MTAKTQAPFLGLANLSLAATPLIAVLVALVTYLP